MSCVTIILEEKEYNINKDEFDRWTHRLSEVLKSEYGTRYFQEFLNKRKFNHTENALKLWKLCDELSNSQFSQVDFKKKLTDLEELANETNLDATQMKSLHDAIEKEDIKPVLPGTMAAAQELMENEYKLFLKELLKKL